MLHTIPATIPHHAILGHNARNRLTNHQYLKTINYGDDSLKFGDMFLVNYKFWEKHLFDNKFVSCSALLWGPLKYS